jgi:subtilisin family serine protease
VRSAPATLINNKISPDLRSLMQTNGGAQVRVIVQSTPGSAGLVGSLLQTLGGLVVNLLSNLNIRIVDIQANSVTVLASDPSVSYVSLDAEVRTTGHIVTTTGAEQVRTKSGSLLDSTLDGSGVSIAVLDSGIDANHKSFSSRSGKIAFSKDFTGENRTDDPYGTRNTCRGDRCGRGFADAGCLRRNRTRRESSLICAFSIHTEWGRSRMCWPRWIGSLPTKALTTSRS